MRLFVLLQQIDDQTNPGRKRRHAAGTERRYTGAHLINDGANAGQLLGQCIDIL
jgi:hypothetical protein